MYPLLSHRYQLNNRRRCRVIPCSISLKEIAHFSSHWFGSIAAIQVSFVHTSVMSRSLLRTIPLKIASLLFIWSFLGALNVFPPAICTIEQHKADNLRFLFSFPTFLKSLKGSTFHYFKACDSLFRNNYFPCDWNGNVTFEEKMIVRNSKHNATLWLVPQIKASPANFFLHSPKFCL